MGFTVIRNIGLANYLRLGCIGLALLGLLVVSFACPLSYVGLRQGAALPQPRRAAQTLRLGPVMLRSGLTTFDSCLDSSRCPTKLFNRRSGEPTAYRLWLFLGKPPNDLHGYKLVDVPVELLMH